MNNTIHGSAEEMSQVFGTLFVAEVVEAIALAPSSAGSERFRDAMKEILSDQLATADLFVGGIIQQVRSHVHLVARPFTGLEEPYRVRLPLPPHRSREDFINTLKRVVPFLDTLGVATSHAAGIELTVEGLPGEKTIRMGPDPTCEMMLGHAVLTTVMEASMSPSTTSSMERAEP